MRVLMLSLDPKIAEEDSNVRERQRANSSNFEELSILVCASTEKEERIVDGNLIVYMPGSGSKSSINTWAKFLGRAVIDGYLEKSKDVLVTSQDPFLLGWIAYKLTRFPRINLELQLHTDIFADGYWRESFKNKIRYIIARFILPRADKIRVVSNRLRDNLVEKFKIKPEKITVLPVAVDIEFFRQAPITVDLHKKYPQFEKVVLMASRLTKEKNVGLAIEAMREVVKTNPKVGLVIVGEGSEKAKLEVRSSELGVGNNVVFENWAEKATLASYYKTADIFLNTSLYEGYGMTLVEAQACGLPVISTDVGIAREIGANIVGWNAEELANKILEFRN